MSSEWYPKIGLPDIHGHEEGDSSLTAFNFLKHRDLIHSLILWVASPSDLKGTIFPTVFPYCLNGWKGLICYAIIPITLTSTMVPKDNDLHSEKQIIMNLSSISPVLITGLVLVRPPDQSSIYLTICKEMIELIPLVFCFVLVFRHQECQL